MITGSGGLFLFLGITCSILRYQFVISGAVTGRPIFLSSAASYGQSMCVGHSGISKNKIQCSKTF